LWFRAIAFYARWYISEQRTLNRECKRTVHYQGPVAIPSSKTKKERKKKAATPLVFIILLIGVPRAPRADRCAPSAATEV